MVRVKGLEPPRLSAPEPKSGASTNSATPAQKNVFLNTERLSSTDLKSFLEVISVISQ